MLHKDAKIELLRRVPLFELCSKGELREIAWIADELPLAAGKGLAREGRARGTSSWSSSKAPPRSAAAGGR